MKRLLLILKSAGAYLLLAAALHNLQAAQILLNTNSVIGGNGSFFDTYNGSVNGGAYNAFKVVSSQTGTISEPSNGSYWLGSNGAANQYFVLDLGGGISIDQIDLFNTHNTAANDRATKNFTILGSNSATFQNSTIGYALVSPTTLLTGTLAFQSAGNDPIEAATYTSSNGLATGAAYRYLQFTETSFYGVGGGLNEIRVFGADAVPEPSRALLLGGGLMGVLLRRRRRASGPDARPL